MFPIRKFLYLFLTILLTVVVFTSACTSSEDYDYESSEYDYEDTDYEEEEGISEYEAIAQAKDEYERYIISKNGFNSDATLTYGECTAESYWGGWKVTLRGNIIGTVDAYHSDYERKNFHEEVSIYD